MTLFQVLTNSIKVKTLDCYYLADVPTATVGGNITNLSENNIVRGTNPQSHHISLVLLVSHQNMTGN